jgi:hypothetical protein
MLAPSLSFGMHVYETSECSANSEGAEGSVQALMEGQGVGLGKEPHLQHEGEGPLQHIGEESDVEGNDFRVGRDGDGGGGMVMCST